MKAFLNIYWVQWKTNIIDIRLINLSIKVIYKIKELNMIKEQTSHWQDTKSPQQPLQMFQGYKDNNPVEDNQKLGK